MSALYKKLEKTCLEYAQARTKVLTQIAKLEARVQKLIEPAQGELRPALDRIKKLHADIETMLPQLADRFADPKTQNIHGVLIGFRKERDKIERPDDIVERAEVLFPELVIQELVKTLDVRRLTTLSDDELARIGCARLVGCDAVVVSIKDGLEDQVNRMGLAS